MHRRTFGEGDALDEAAHARPHFDRIHGFEVAGELIPVRDDPLDGGRDGNLGRLLLWNVLPAGGAKCEDGSGGPPAGVNSEGRRCGARESGTHVARLHDVGLLLNEQVALPTKS